MFCPLSSSSSFSNPCSCRPREASGTALGATGKLRRRSSSGQASSGGSRRTTPRCALALQTSYLWQPVVEQRQQGLAPGQPQPPTTRRLLTLLRRKLRTKPKKSRKKLFQREKRSPLVHQRLSHLLPPPSRRRRRLVLQEPRKTCPSVTLCSQSLEVTTNPGRSSRPSTPSSSRHTRRSSRPRWTSPR